MTHKNSVSTSNVHFIIKLLNIVSVHFFITTGESEHSMRAVGQQRQSVWKQQQGESELPVITDTDTQQTYSRPWSGQILHDWSHVWFLCVCVCVSGQRRNIQRDVQENSKVCRRCSDWRGDEDVLKQMKVISFWILSSVWSCSRVATLKCFGCLFQDQRSLHDDLSGSSDNLSDTSKVSSHRFLRQVTGLWCNITSLHNSCSQCGCN